MNEHVPTLTFACELDSQRVQELFNNPDVVQFLQDTRSGVSLGILDLSDERAKVVRCLNEAEVPVTAWLLLPKDQGYWFNLDNHAHAIARYEQFRAWTAEHDLRWARIGLDIEPDLSAMQMLSKYPLAGAQRLLPHAFDFHRLRSGVRAYRSLVEQIHRDGYTVETYQFPFIMDDRMARSNVLQRMTGLVDLSNVDHEVLMLYSSFTRPWGQGILWNYGQQARGIGIGSTGGGVDLEGALNTPPLNWAELQTDLLLARQLTEEIFVFSLEGCVQQNFLPLLREMNWQQPVPIPVYEAKRAENVRRLFQRGLWLAARPAWMLFGLALAVSAVTALWRRRR